MPLAAAQPQRWCAHCAQTKSMRSRPLPHVTQLGLAGRNRAQRALAFGWAGRRDVAVLDPAILRLAIRGWREGELP